MGMSFEVTANGLTKKFIVIPLYIEYHSVRESFKMKKAILLAAVLFITLSAKGFTDESAFFEIHGLLQGGLGKNYDSILQKASSLTALEKMILLDIHEKNCSIIMCHTTLYRKLLAPEAGK
jgi:hypothetical protein